MIPSWVQLGVWLLVLLTAAVVFLAALLIWRNGYVRGWRASRSKPPTCLHCGYNLSGLTYCRCPECGKEFRLEELWTIPSKQELTRDSLKKKFPDPEIES